MRALKAIVIGGLLLSGAAPAAPVKELDPVHVNAMRNPEVKKYKAILAGLDTFDKYHGLAPAVGKLQFRLSARGKDEMPEPLAVRLAGDDGFRLPLALDAGNRFEVPRNAAALAAKSELELNRKRRAYRIEPDIRTPGLAANQRRLGDLRLECKVMIAIGKEEMPLWGVALVNGVLLRTDWCSFFGDETSTAYGGVAKEATFGSRAEAPLAQAVLIDGNRSALLEVSGSSFNVPIGNSTWSDDAIVELHFAGPPTGTAGETPRTAP
ncbi:hypothetical protein [Massilia sp. H6]|uniref:hypothetical protein n=1 Tax=Massilia sp. H6 TaxID=2970464 RepID=UPI002166E6A3|nr:hypothetical protein [Massilia sp. H6]UVW26832.1 hypothetical protein NRS07_09560 [Massilia sp. H6]